MRSVEEMQAGLRTAMNEIQSIKDDLEQFKNAKSSGDLTADFKKKSANAKTDSCSCNEQQNVSS